MAKWPAVCRPKDLGGLGIINTQVCRPKDLGGLGIIITHVLNKCLMTKWIWKLYYQKGSLWARILDAKYMRMVLISLGLVPAMGLSSGRACTRSNIFLNGVLPTKLGMGS
jgi:hypothetical protein